MWKQTTSQLELISRIKFRVSIFSWKRGTERCLFFVPGIFAELLQTTSVGLKRDLLSLGGLSWGRNSSHGRAVMCGMPGVWWWSFQGMPNPCLSFSGGHDRRRYIVESNISRSVWERSCVSGRIGRKNPDRLLLCRDMEENKNWDFFIGLVKPDGEVFLSFPVPDRESNKFRKGFLLWQKRFQ